MEPEPFGGTFCFSNIGCDYFPCHTWEREEPFNCMFCYCPLYVLGPACGGAYQYTKRGIKDCSKCLVPHAPGGYAHIRAKIPEVLALMEEKNDHTCEDGK